MKRFFPSLIAVFTFFLCFFTAQIVWAAEEETALTQVTHAAIEILVPILAAFGAWLVHRLVRVFETKTHVEFPDKQEAKIDTWIEEGIHLAAEKSYQKVKAKTEKLKGPEKLEEAADYVFALANARGWFDWTKEKIKAKTEAQLGMHRANGGVPAFEEKAE